MCDHSDLEIDREKRKVECLTCGAVFDLDKQDQMVVKPSMERARQREIMEETVNMRRSK